MMLIPVELDKANAFVAREWKHTAGPRNNAHEIAPRLLWEKALAEPQPEKASTKGD